MNRSQNLVLDDLVQTASMGLHSFKGVQEMQELFSLVPLPLSGRDFPDAKDEQKCGKCLARMQCPTCDAWSDACMVRPRRPRVTSRHTRSETLSERAQSLYWASEHHDPVAHNHMVMDV